MDTSRLTNSTVRKAFDALQAGDQAAWQAQFADEVTFTDDGNPRDFTKFTDSALGTERFVTIARVENDGKDIFGDFTTEQWGDFRVYFKFQLDDHQQINRLDIGQY